MRNKKYNILELQNNRKMWSSIKTDFWTDENKKLFENRKMAVDMYIDDESCKDIENKTGIGHDLICKYISRCLKFDIETNIQLGYTALIPNKKISKEKIFKKDAISKTRGSLTRLLSSYPVLEKLIHDNYFRNKNSTLEKIIMPSNLYKKFIDECKKLKIQDYEYPFNTKDNAKRSFYKYLKQIEIKYGDLSIKREDKNAQQKFKSTGIGTKIRGMPLMPFSEIQLDGHKIDMLYTVNVVNNAGEIVSMPATRVWLIAVIDVATRTILGYSLTPNENYNKTDVLNAIRNSIIPKKMMEITISGLKYPSNYGYYSLAFPKLEWSIPNIIMLDNAKSHLSDIVIDKLTKKLHCSLNFGSVATPETRGVIERVFKTLEDNGYHRMVSTTGSNINDNRRVNAEKDAVKYKVTFEDICQLTEILIASYNSSSHSALDNQSPLECMRRRVFEAGMFPCIANSEMKKYIYELTNIIEIKTIRGNAKYGKRPYVTYQGVEYRNDILSQSMELIGKKIIVEINPDNIRTLKGYFENGIELGILTAIGEWGRKEHSLKTRNEAIKWRNYNKEKFESLYVPLTGFENDLKERAVKERRARTKFERIKKEQENTNPTNEILSSIPNLIKNNDEIIEDTNELTEIESNDNYSIEELEKILEVGSIEDAFERGLI